MAVTVESFEGLAISPNVVKSFRFGDYGFLQPGYISPFSFASGLKLLEPIPNDNDDNGETLVGDYALMLDTEWGLGDNGRIKTANDLPDGMAFIGANRERDGTLTFGFAKAVYSVSAFVDAVRDEGLKGAITATAYDAAGNVITSSRILSVPLAGWDENLISLHSAVPIAKVVFTGDFLVLDKLSFDDALPNVIKGTNRNDNIKPVAGKNSSDGADVILGRKGNDKIKAGDGDDTVYGGKGNDKLRGGNGNDTLSGDQGHDKLWGNAGQDSFLFKTLSGVDKIKGFNVAEDNILIARDAIEGFLPGHLRADLFNDGSTPVNVDHRIIYKAGSGKLIYDENGSAKGKAVVFAKLAPNLDLTADNFFIV